MKDETIGKRKLKLYDSIEELPIMRYHKFNKFMLVDSGIGSDLEDIDTHVSKIKAFMIKNDMKSASTHLDNLRSSLYLIGQEINSKHMAYVCLIHSIDGKELPIKLSDDFVKETHLMLEEANRKLIDKILDLFKKKVESELEYYFPGKFDDPLSKEYSDKLRERAMFQLGTIINGTDNSNNIEKIDYFLLTLVKPKVFSGKKSAEVLFEKEFENMCLYLRDELKCNPINMNTLEFFNAFEYIKKYKHKDGRKSPKIQRPS